MPAVHTVRIVQDTATPLLRTLRRVVADKRSMNDTIGMAAAKLTRAHVVRIARERHATADRLGAQPTKFYARAADAVRHFADTTETKVIIDHPGFARARREVELRPKHGTNWLTLPIHRLSYGKRAREMNGLFPLKAKSGKLYLVRKLFGGKRILPLFLLLKKVTQPMAKWLLPSDEAYTKAANVAVRDLISSQLKGGGS